MLGKPHPEQDQIDLYEAARLRSGRLLREITTPVSAGQNSAYDLLQPFLFFNLDYSRADISYNLIIKKVKFMNIIKKLGVWLISSNIYESGGSFYE